MRQVTLTYTCVCPNGTIPDSSAYEQTLPFYICEETFRQCMANNPDNAQGQGVCQENQQCGSRNATAEALAATSSAASTTASETESSATGSAASSAASATASEAGASMTTYTSGAFAVLLMAAFRLLL